MHRDWDDIMWGFDTFYAVVRYTLVSVLYISLNYLNKITLFFWAIILFIGTEK